MRRLTLAVGLALLYGPIALLVLLSFNASRLLTQWSGFSWRWYLALSSDSALLESAWASLRVAVLSALLATLVGTLAAIVLTRFPRAPGRTLLSASLNAPLVVPDVVLGLALLLVFIAAGLDRGLLTVVIAHATFTACFVAAVVRAKLSTLDPAMEEAARDLGATPAVAFRDGALPQLLPAIVSGFLLAFTLSLDDLVIASFTAGPGATTLPMRIYSQLRLGVTPEINALSTLMLGVVAAVLIPAAILARRR